MTLTIDTLVRAGTPVPLMARLLKKTVDEVEDMLIEYGRTNNPLAKEDCGICYEGFVFGGSKTPTQTPCCNKFMCVACTRKCVTKHEEIGCCMSCPFCRKNLLINDRLFAKWEKMA